MRQIYIIYKGTKILTAAIYKKDNKNIARHIANELNADKDKKVLYILYNSIKFSEIREYEVINGELLKKTEDLFGIEYNKKIREQKINNIIVNGNIINEKTLTRLVVLMYSLNKDSHGSVMFEFIDKDGNARWEPLNSNSIFDYLTKTGNLIIEAYNSNYEDNV